MLGLATLCFNLPLVVWVINHIFFKKYLFNINYCDSNNISIDCEFIYLLFVAGNKKFLRKIIPTKIMYMYIQAAVETEKQGRKNKEE